MRRAAHQRWHENSSDVGQVANLPYIFKGDLWLKNYSSGSASD